MLTTLNAIPPPEEQLSITPDIVYLRLALAKSQHSVNRGRV